MEAILSNEKGNPRYDEYDDVSTTINCTGFVGDMSLLPDELSPIQDLNKIYCKLPSSNVKKKSSVPRNENRNSKNIIQSPKLKD